MKIKKNDQNPKTTKRQKEEKKELNQYKEAVFEPYFGAMSTAALSSASWWDYGPINKIILPNGKVYNVVDSDNLKID